MGDVRYVGLKDLGDDAVDVQRLVERSLGKFERSLPFFDLIIHIKLYRHQGRPKYTFTGRIDGSNIVVKADASDWDLKKTVHMLLSALENKTEHLIKREGQHQERFHPKKAKRGTDTRVKLKLRGRSKMI